MTQAAANRTWPGLVNRCSPHGRRLCLGSRHEHEREHLDLGTDPYAIILGPDAGALDDVTWALCLSGVTAGLRTTLADPTASALAFPGLTLVRAAADIHQTIASTAATIGERLHELAADECRRTDLAPTLVVLHRWSTIVHLESFADRLPRRRGAGGAVENLTLIVSLGPLVGVHVVITDPGYPPSLTHLGVQFARGYRVLLRGCRADDAALLFPALAGVPTTVPDLAPGQALIGSAEGQRCSAMFYPPPDPSTWPPDADRPRTR